MSIYTARRIGALLLLIAAIGYSCLWWPIDTDSPYAAFTFWTTILLGTVGGEMLTTKPENTQKNEPPNADTH